MVANSPRRSKRAGEGLTRHSSLTLGRAELANQRRIQSGLHRTRRSVTMSWFRRPARRRHLLSFQPPGDKPKALVHHVTLVRRHAPPVEEGQSVTDVPGMNCCPCLGKGIKQSCNSTLTVALTPVRPHTVLAKDRIHNPRGLAVASL
jgi:hypothetical protein